ncbi:MULTISPECIES: hypothetical protein [Pseudomonas]|uniref:hypothetical protein n=1 Tax=Pseudomonas TaxID=286 RepID=UPI000D8F95E3|nr:MULTISPECIES: hypothetical protein [Pseudomonas]MCY7261326.1 hypothetical protein [Pseudomonas protegens]MDP9506212.1 hypothetical protein [Pseudomonas protegens]PYB96142.1 hypothetical protein DMX09_28765 [Pseudomonas protegens]UZE33707.1 hypothetical protein LOY69_23790 [Pseudomonas sp. B21-059]
MKLQSSLRPFALISALALTLGGCAIAKPSNDDLKNRAQITIGKPVSTVSNVRSDASQTYFTANTSNGGYECVLPSGGMVAFATMGGAVALPAQCTKQ